MADYATRRANVQNHLDACGIGHDVQDRLEPIIGGIIAFAGQVQHAGIRQAIYDEMTNRPCRIPLDSPTDDPASRACIAGVIRALTTYIEWDIIGARRIAADLLEDVNDHKKAEIIRSWNDDDET